MEFQLHQAGDLPYIEAYQSGEIMVDGTVYHQPIAVQQHIFRLPENWQPEMLSLVDFQTAVDARVEVIVVGTGEKQRFLSPELQVALAQHGIGLECMTTAAACRTVMLLQSEGRMVWAWLLV